MQLSRYVLDINVCLSSGAVDLYRANAQITNGKPQEVQNLTMLQCYADTKVERLSQGPYTRCSRLYNRLQSLNIRSNGCEYSYNK